MSEDRSRDDAESRQRGERLATEIPRHRLPAERVDEIRLAMREKLSAEPKDESAEEKSEEKSVFAKPDRWGVSRSAWLAAAATAFLLLGTWWALRGPQLRLLAADDAAGALESLAISAHESLRQDGAESDLTSSDPREVRKWLEDLRLSADLAVARPVEDRGRFELLGASKLPTEFAAAAVSYRIDGRPVTLAVTTSSRAPEVPHWSLLRKNVRISTDPASGGHVLTWRNAGKAYTLVSELPGRGLGACLICHIDSKRRRLVADLQADW